MTTPTTPSTPAASAPAARGAAVEFIQSHEPPLARGDYRLTMRQSVTVAGATHEFSTTRRFLVRGSRSLQPTDVVGVFPPDQQLGEYSRTMPQIALSRSTFPWERSALPGASASWLTLLLFADDEAPTPAVVTLGALRAASAGAPWWPGLPAEEGEDETAKVTVIDLPRALLAIQLPDAADLATLTHVRHPVTAGAEPDSDAGPASGADIAVVVGGRLPVLGGRSTVHLVSLENRFAPGDAAPARFAFGSIAESDSIRLLSLFSWSFSCVDPAQTFTQLLSNLNPYGPATPAGSPSSLRLPAAGYPTAERAIAQGNIPLRHQLRDGAATVSWYRGPLVPAPLVAAPTSSVPARTGDALVQYNPATGLLDVSYAAAWELGRLLTLASRQVSTSLYLYKRQLIQQAKAATQTDGAHLPVATPIASSTGDVVTTVTTWFEALRTLTGVPFYYLVPDERLLPAESLRFFSVDPTWLRCLLDGAYSIGRVTASDAGYDTALPANPLNATPAALSGALIRSAVIAGWPDVEVSATDANGATLTQARRAQPARDILLVLFEGELAALEVAEKAQALHLGFDVRTGTTDLFKRLRDPRSGHEKSDGLVIDTVPWRDAAARVVAVEALRAAIDLRVGTGVNGPVTTSAQFALQMVEGVEQVVFSR